MPAQGRRARCSPSSAEQVASGAAGVTSRGSQTSAPGRLGTPAADSGASHENARENVRRAPALQVGAYTPPSDAPLALGACPAHGVPPLNPARAAWRHATVAAARALALELCPTTDQVAQLVRYVEELAHDANNGWQVAACERYLARLRTPRGLPVAHPRDARAEAAAAQPTRVGGGDHA